jgi:signal transduction histidine kinase
MTNRAFLHTFGLREGDVLGVPAERIVTALQERGGGAAAVAALLAAADVQGGASATVTLGGHDARELEVSIAALQDREGRRFGRMLVSRDLTGERAAQRELQERADQLELRRIQLERAQEELERKRGEERAHAEELDRVNRELRRLDEMRQQLLGNVSHELQAPLVAIRGFTEMILRERLGPITEEQRRGLSLSLSNTDRLIGLIETIASRPGDDALRLTQFPLRTLIEETISLLRAKMEEKGIHFSLDAPDDGLVVQADRDKIQQVFINVLQNAIKFNRQGGSIEIAIRRSGERFLDVDVTDTGKGILPDALERIFDRHYRSEGTSEEGQGLGLAIVREILDRHGCRIRARSEPGKWTRISFSLPQAKETERDPATDDDESSEGPPDGSGRPRFRVIRRYRRR